jgi:hypothetical protein
MQALLKFSKAIDWLSSGVGKLTMWLILITTLISAGNAVVRKIFNTSSNAMLEIQWYLFAGVFMLGAGYCLLKNAHAQLTNLVFIQRHHGLGKGLGHQHTGAGVFGRVGFLKSAPRHVLLVGLVFHADALGRRQALVVAVELQDVGVARDRPKAVIRRVFI